MKKARMIPLLLLLPSLLAACGGNEAKSSSAPVEEKEVLFNGYENNDDLFLVRQLLPSINYSVLADLSINHDKQFTRTGDGSLRLEYGNSMYSQVYQRIDNSSIKDRDIADISSISVWVYVETGRQISFDLNIVVREQVVLSSISETIQPKQWTKVTYDINKVLLDAKKKDIQAFSFTAKSTGYPLVCYIDDFNVSFGASYTETDKEYLKKVNEIDERILAVGEDVSPSDSAKVQECRDILLAYNALPELYRGALQNFETFETALYSYVSNKGTDEVSESTPIGYHFGTPFGFSQASLADTGVFGLSYSEEMHLANETGALKVSVVNGGNSANYWDAFNLKSSLSLAYYDEVSFSVYNDTKCPLGLCVYWSSLVSIPVGAWTTVTLKVSNFAYSPTTTCEIEFTGLDSNGNAMPLSGDIYFSNATFSRVSAASYLAKVKEALESLGDVKYNDMPLINELYADFESLQEPEQEKVDATEALRLLDKAKQEALVEGQSRLPELVNALPNNNDFPAYILNSINDCYDIYKSMDEQQQSAFVGKDKLLSLYEFANSKYELIFMPKKNMANYSDFAGKSDNVEIIYDETYGPLAHHTSNDCKYGIAIRYADYIEKRISDYEEIEFWVSSKKEVRFGLFEQLWWTNAYDFSTGETISDLLATGFRPSGDAMIHCTIDSATFATMPYYMFNSHSDNGAQPIDAKITAFYGVKK